MASAKRRKKIEHTETGYERKEDPRRESRRDKSRKKEEDEVTQRKGL